MIQHPPNVIATADANLHPWHCLGTRVDGLMSVEEVLEATGANDRVTVKPLYDAEGSEHPTHYNVESNLYGSIFAVQKLWWPLQRREILELAYTITGQDSFDDARIETAGNVGSRAEVFFAYMRFEDLVIDPGGVADRIERGLYAATSYNQSIANIFGYSNLQLACMNALSMRLRGLSQTISVKHTRNAEANIIHAAEVLGYVGAVEEATRRTAEKMLGIDGGQALDVINDVAFPIDEESMSVRTVTAREKERDEVRRRYEETYRFRYGANAWAAWGALTERDHTRVVRAERAIETRAFGSVFPGKWARVKADTQAAVLEKAGVGLQSAGVG